MKAIVTRAEWRWVVVMALAVMIWTAVPYLVAARTANAAWYFGGTLLAVEDGNSYIANLGQGARGAWLFTLPYTSEQHRPVLVYLFYLLLGKLAGPDHGALVVTFHAARIVCGAGLLVVSYRFLAEFLSSARQRLFGLLLVAVGGGLGWLLAFAPAPLFGSLPVDFISPEAFSFLLLFGLPHLALARCCLLLGLLAYLHGRGVVAGLFWLGLGLIQPLYLPIAWLLMAGDIALGPLLATMASSPAAEAVGSVVRQRPGWRENAASVIQRLLASGNAARLRTALIAVMLSAPMLLYTLYAFSSDPILAAWNAQNRLPSPHPLHYLLAYVPWLLPAMAGWHRLWVRQQRLALVAGVWVLSAALLLYLPIPTQRRLIEGVQLPLAALAVLGLTALAARWRVVAGVMLSAAVVPTACVLWLGALAAAGKPSEPIFLPQAQVAVFNRLASVAQVGQMALAAYPTGNALPAYTPLAAYIGHGPETIGLDEKRLRVARFYQAGTPDSERRALLAEGRIAWVLFGPHERALGAFDPDLVDYLAFDFAAGHYAVYAVVR